MSDHDPCDTVGRVCKQDVINAGNWPGSQRLLSVSVCTGGVGCSENERAREREGGKERLIKFQIKHFAYFH